MLRSAASKAVWLGRTTSAILGLAIVLALVVGAATTALAAVPGDPFQLGKVNSINRLSTLVGSSAGALLKVDNNGAGSALDLQVGSAASPSSNTVPPMKVNSQARVANLNAALAGRADSAANADKLDGQLASAFQQRVSGGCEVGSSIQTIGEDGSVTCEVDDDTSAAQVNALKTELGTDDGASNQESDPVSLSKVKNIDPNILSRNANTLDNLDSTEFASRTHTHVGADIASGTVEADRIEDGPGSNLNADQLDGLDSSIFARKSDLQLSDGTPNQLTDPVDFTKVKNIPSDVINRNADTLDGLNSSNFALGTSGKANDADKLDGKDSTDFQGGYKRTVVVSPVPNDAVASGTALKNALNGITGASQTNPYLLKIEPGVYDLGSQQFSRLFMKSFVDVEGSGEGVTTITSSNTSSTVVGAANSELRSLTVKHTGGSTSATAIFNTAENFRVTQVTAVASGTDMVINEGLALFGTEELSQVTATASGASARNTGVRIGGTATLDQVTATASGGSIDGSRGVEISAVDATAALNQVTATASGGPFSFGVHNVGDTQIQSSSISGGTRTLGNYAGTLRVGASQLDGPPVYNDPSSTELTCAGVYDEDYAFYSNTCP